MVELTATNLLEEAVTLNPVSSAASGVKAEIVHSGERDWKIQITAVPLAKDGKLTGTVQLNFSSGIERIPVSGTVTSVITAIPDRIELSAGSKAPVQRVVMLKSEDGKAFDILSADLLGAEGTVTPWRISDDRWQCSLSILPFSITPGAVLRIISANEIQPEITIPLTVVHR